MNEKLLDEICCNAPLWNKDLEELVTRPYNYLSNNTSGKNFRTLLIKNFNEIYYHLPPDKVELICLVAEKLHNASLIIDDIEDNSEQRRGLKTCHLVYGIAGSLNSANYAYFEALQLLIDYNKLIDRNDLRLLTIIKIFNEELLNLHRGQGLDIYWRDYMIRVKDLIPKEIDYYNMVMNKTGGLFRLIIKLMQCYIRPEEENIKQNEENVHFCNLLGILYQVKDDYLNLIETTEVSINKGTFAEDITEGKFSFPIIHGINYELERENSSFIYNILRSKTKNPETKRKVLDYLKNESKSLDYTKDKIIEIGELIKKKYLSDTKKFQKLIQIIDKLIYGK
ncbi:related to Geranylgeranyl pyrophosphate synthase [Saccharomycodes ludwigii]|uniref:Related to Geranylgeranyl pyrophosphate synthase n=1 Tax=Saccharomycodes ludwigii TaxID=36035 RepID=A0A376B9P4_9ASCO|nr:hypothetical protein SCDLUD_002007 [Saccharomycodes ludwigii]KAH3902192.1 hypothetical protein SCDLUD_002007 [Saccharomycodes ludwigii]SSD61289.1 related to Geranylgeranyl pyrophosphate synthase [Saccharomycodes ludwigii]